MKNIYYFCNHPYPLVIMDSIATIYSKNFKDLRQYLIFVKHPYFNNLLYSEYFNNFDKVYYLPWIDYENNVFKNIRKHREYIGKLKSIPFEDSALFFTISYSDLATNIFCNYIKNFGLNNKIIHFSIYGNFLDVSNGVLNIFKTILANLNAFLFNGRYLKIYTNSFGILIDKIYTKDPHDQIFMLSSSNSNSISKFPFIPYPLTLLNGSRKLTSKLLIFFADTSLIDQYNLDSILFYEIINKMISTIIKKYKNKNIKFIYKPHPLDKDCIPDQIKNYSLSLFGEKLTAEMIFLKYRNEIEAIYSISSVACLTGSYQGIPSYVAYRLFSFAEHEMKLFKQYFKYSNRQTFLELQSFDEIGVIDNKKHEQKIDDNHDEWLNLLKNSIY